MCLNIETDMDTSIRQNEKLIWYTIRKYYPEYLTDEDAVQELRITLWKCLKLYDVKQNTSFSTYCIRAMLNCLHVIHRKNQREIPPEMIYSLDAPIGKDQDMDICLKDVVPAPQESLLEVQHISDFLHTLKPQHRRAALLLLNGVRQVDIAKILGCSQPQVSKIRKSIINKYHVWKEG